MPTLSLSLQKLQDIYKNRLEMLQHNFEVEYLFDLADNIIKIELSVSDSDIANIQNENDNAIIDYDTYAEIRMHKIIELNKAIFDGVKGNGY
jgi:hypothetical protein